MLAVLGFLRRQPRAAAAPAAARGLDSRCRPLAQVATSLTISSLQRGAILMHGDADAHAARIAGEGYAEGARARADRARKDRARAARSRRRRLRWAEPPRHGRRGWPSAGRRPRTSSAARRRPPAHRPRSASPARWMSFHRVSPPPAPTATAPVSTGAEPDGSCGRFADGSTRRQRRWPGSRRNEPWQPWAVQPAAGQPTIVARLADGHSPARSQTNRCPSPLAIGDAVTATSASQYAAISGRGGRDGSALGALSRS